MCSDSCVNSEEMVMGSKGYQSIDKKSTFDNNFEPMAFSATINCEIHIFTFHKLSTP